MDRSADTAPKDVELEKRLQFLSSMKDFVDGQKNKLESVLSRLKLSFDQLQKMELKKVSPLNVNHIVPERGLEKHMESYRLLAAGCQKDELEVLLQDGDFWYKDCERIMKVEIDENQLNKIIWNSCVQNGQVYTGHRQMPSSHIDENIMLTQDDRLAVYRHVVNASKEAGKVMEVDKTDEQLTTDWGALVKKGLLDEQSNKQFSSKLEQLAALRDMKRRRQSYRAKNVHVTKKSYTEIIREVIVNQMEILKPPRDDAEQSSDHLSEVRDEAGDETSFSHSTRRNSSPRRRDRRDERDRERSSRSGREERYPRDRQNRDRRSEERESEQRESSDQRGRRDEGRRREREDDYRRREERDYKDGSDRRRERDSYRSSQKDRGDYEREDRKYKADDDAGREFSKYSNNIESLAVEDVYIKQEAASDEDDGNKYARENRDVNRSRRKRSRSLSQDSSNSDYSDRKHKSKKSKHKKKHSKKHKRKA